MGCYRKGERPRGPLKHTRRFRFRSLSGIWSRQRRVIQLLVQEIISDAFFTVFLDPLFEEPTCPGSLSTRSHCMWSMYRPVLGCLQMLLDLALNTAKIAADKAVYGLVIWELDSTEEAQVLRGLYGHRSSYRTTICPQGHNHPVSSTLALWLKCRSGFDTWLKEKLCKGRCRQSEIKSAWLFTWVWACLNDFCYCNIAASFLPCNWLWFIYLFSSVMFFAFMETNCICQFRLKVVLVFF